MSKTRHIQQRMNQRGISSKMLELVLQFGTRDQDKMLLGKKNIRKVLAELDRLRKSFLDMEKKGGLVLVEKDGAEITTYALNSYRRPR